MIKRSIENDGNILPDIMNAVHSLPKEVCFNNEYKLRAPGRIVYLSLNKVFSEFQYLLDEFHKVHELVKITKDYNKIDFYPLSTHIRDVLNAINSFIEDCNHLFKLTTPVNEETKNNKETVVHKWLREAKHPTFKKFYDEIKEYKEGLTKYLNPEKHEHHRIEIIVGKFEENYTLGYTMNFMEKTLEESVETFDLRNVRTIITEFSYHFYMVYVISQRFTKHIIDAIKYYHSIDIHLNKFVNDSFHIGKIVKGLTFHEILVFPNNELLLPKTYISLSHDELIIDYPIGLTENKKGVTQSFRIKDKPFPENRLLIMPSNKLMKKIRMIKESTNMTVSDKDKEDLICLIFKTEKEGEHYNYELDYKHYFKIFSNSGMTFSFVFAPFGVPKLNMKPFEIDYLDFKFQLKN